MVLENGRFVESGRFEELLKKRGPFYRYYWRQFGGLAIFKQQLALEMERAARYGSHFCLAMLKYRKYDELIRAGEAEDADRFMEALDYLIKRNIRLGDNSSILSGNTILILLPEIDSERLKAFFKRLTGILITSTEIAPQLTENDFLLAGVRVSKRLFRTPEEMVAALMKKTVRKECGAATYQERELL